jgi:tetratricopeptide (TPR) repeat protein
MLGAASSTAAEGDLALTERRYLEAAKLFGEAAGYVPSGHGDVRGGYLRQKTNALARQGSELGDDAALRDAIDVYESLLTAYPRAQAPLEWAATQTQLGAALATLGERETKTARLEDAVAAYRQALEENTRERAPLQWALTQAALGDALLSLGEREDGTARLEEAVAAYREALKQMTREGVRLNWAKTSETSGRQGVALIAIADRTKNGAVAETALRQIQAAYEMARSDGNEQLAARFNTELTKAQAIRDRLKGQGGQCSGAESGTAPDRTPDCGVAGASETKKP